MSLRRNFEVKQLGELRTLEIYLYGEIQSDYYDWWAGKVIESTTSADYVRKAITEAGTVDNINVYINSCGGSVSEGIAIYNILKRAQAYKTVYVDAFAYSIASVIAMAGDKVVMPSNTTMMIHNAMMSAFGNAAELRKAADDLDVINEASCNSYLTKTKKIDKDKLTELLDAETYLTAEQALEIGLCDEIANPVDLSQAVEIVEQAQRSKNPTAKKAVEFMRSAAQSKPLTPLKQKTLTPEPVPEPEPKKDKFEWLSNIVNSKNLL